MELKTVVFKTDDMTWEERPNEHTGKSYFRKMLHVDDENGMRVNMARYPAGTMTPLHDHPCGHGMYVLEGTLKTPEGNYGPGTFVWYPEGIITEHGATQDEDLTVLFFSNKHFDIHYCD